MIGQTILPEADLNREADQDRSGNRLGIGPSWQILDRFLLRSKSKAI